MNRRFLYILVAVFIILMLLVLWQEDQIIQRFVATPEPTAFLEGSFLGRALDYTVLDIQAIRLRDPASGANFIISRAQDGTWIAPEADGLLDPEGATRIAQTVVLAPYADTIPVSDSVGLEQFGFAPEGNFSIELLLRNGVGHVIAIGGITAGEQAVYALIDDQSVMYLLDRRPVEYLRQQLSKPPLT